MLEKIVSLIAPHICIGCGSENDALLCPTCCEQLPAVPSRCYRCKAVTDDYAVCKPCRRYTSLQALFVATYYEETAKEIVRRVKYERAQAGTSEMAELMAPLLRAVDTDSYLVHIPTATSRVRARGYDHAKLLTAHISKRTKLETKTYLGRLGQAHQVGAGRQTRLQQLEYAFRPVAAKEISGKNIILVDDVMTTGATLEIAARTLRRCGAKSVSAVVFAQA